MLSCASPVATPPRTVPSPPPSCGRATGSTSDRRCLSSNARARWCEASFGPAAAAVSGAIPRSCGASVAPRWPRSARRWSRSIIARWPASCPAGRTSTVTRRPEPASTGCARHWFPFRASPFRPRSGSGTYCLGAWAPTRPTWMDQLCASGEIVWIGAGALGRHSGRVALYFREDLPLLGSPPAKVATPDGDAHAAVRERLTRGACFFTDLLIDVELVPEELQEALWDLAWAGEVTNDAFAPLRAPRLTLARAQRDLVRRGGRFSVRQRRGAAAQIQGRWSLTAPLLGSARRSGRPAAGLGRTVARAVRGPDPRAGSGRRGSRRFLRPLPGALPARDAGHRSPRVLRRGAGGRTVRLAGSGRAAALSAL